MTSITIISGGLGTGKTTLSKTLAHAEAAGLHFVTDTFYHFPAHPLDPTTAEAHEQNRTIIRAIGRAAAAFAEGGIRSSSTASLARGFCPHWCPSGARWLMWTTSFYRRP